METTRYRSIVGVALALALTAPAAMAQVGLVPADRAELYNHHADLTSVVNARNVDQMNFAWSIVTKDPVSHRPLLDGDRVYFTDWGGYVYSADANTGKILWKKKVQEKVKKEWPWHGFALASGAMGTGQASNLLYEASVEGMAYAIDKNTGNVVWSTDIAEDEQAGNLANMLYYDGLVYIGLSSVEEVLSKKPGFEVNFRGKVLALNAMTGELVWERWLVTPPRNGVAVWSSFAIDPELNMLYFTTSNNYTEEATELSDALVAADPKTGEIKWFRQVVEHDIWTMADPKGPDYAFGAGPQLFEVAGRKLVGAGNKNGVFYVWDRVTGEKVWTTTVGYGQVGGGIHGEASVGDGALYIWGNNGFPYKNPKQHPMDIKKVDAATGKYLWVQTKAQPALQISAGFLANDVYFVGSIDGQVRAYRASDGKKLWTSGSHGSVASSLTVDGGMLLWGSGVPKAFGGQPPYGVFAYSIAAKKGRAMGEPPAQTLVRKD